MIKKLKIKFVFIAMLSVVLVLGSILTWINVSNYLKIAKDSDAILRVLLINDGTFPAPPAEPDPQSAPGNSGAPGENQGDAPEPPAGGREDGALSPETPFESRFFCVRFTGDTATADVSHVAAVTENEAVAYATALKNANKTGGFTGNYRYAAETKENGETLYVFLDAGRSLKNFENFLTQSLLAGGGGTLLILALVLLLSGFILKPVEESYKKQKSFITNASHDIKTPLAVISADNEVIEMENGPSEWTKGIRKQVERLTALTEKLVFLSRMEEENELVKSEFDLSEAVSEIADAYFASAKARNLSLETHVEPNVKYVGNAEMLKQAVALVMDNAVKYASDNGAISVYLRKNKHNIELRFTNPAENVAQGNRDELFDRFYRADASRNFKTGGNGIGLSVVKAIANAHGGKTHAFSPDGKSLEITVTL